MLAMLIFLACFILMPKFSMSQIQDHTFYAATQVNGIFVTETTLAADTLAQCIALCNILSSCSVVKFT